MKENEALKLCRRYMQERPEEWDKIMNELGFSRTPPKWWRQQNDIRIMGENMDIPDGWRKGQTIFNFLEWLRVEKGVGGNQNERLADPFHLSDKEWDKYWKEFIREYK